MNINEPAEQVNEPVLSKEESDGIDELIAKMEKVTIDK